MARTKTTRAPKSVNCSYSVSKDGKELTVKARLDGEAERSKNGTGPCYIFAGLYGEIPELDGHRLTLNLTRKVDYQSKVAPKSDKVEMPSAEQVALFFASQKG